MTVSPDRAIAAIKTWFAQLPDQIEMRTLMLELPDGRNAPNADGFVVPTRGGGVCRNSLRGAAPGWPDGADAVFDPGHAEYMLAREPFYRRDAT